MPRATQSSQAKTLDRIAAEARACTACALPLGPRPTFRVSVTARLLIVGQAPGVRVHNTGIPWNDPSGERLRAWLAVDRAAFYDQSRVAIIPIGLCYPGTAPNGGDYPPRPACAPLWHPRLVGALPNIELTLLVGSYAQAHYLGARRGASMTETVRAFRDHLPAFLPIPHPSWRTNAWQKRNAWFDTEVLPELRRRVHVLMGR